MLDFGFTCLCVCEDQCFIEAEQPAFMQGVWEVIGLLPDPQHRHLGIYIRFGAFPGVLGGRWERLGGVRGLSWRILGAPGKLLGRSRMLWDARGRFRRPPGRSGTTGQGPNTTPVMVWRLPPRPTTPRGPPQQHSGPSPQNIQIQQDYYSYKLTRIMRTVVSGASTRFEAQGLGGSNSGIA